MNLFSSFSGMIDAQLISADIPAALGALADAGISLYDVMPKNEVSVRFRVPRNAFRQLKMRVTRRGDEVTVLGRSGIYWKLKAAVQRPVLLCGILFLLFLGLFLPSRVLFVRVEGNTSVPQRQILEAAEHCGIQFGASRREVRSEKMKNALLEELPRLQWAGVNTYGCVAVISVRERTVSEQENPLGAVCSIVALCDGIVTSCTANSGNLLCSPGQAVKSGEVLISGYTDCGIAIQASRADGEVFAQTTREISVLSPKNCLIIWDKGETYRGVSLLMGKKRINLWKDSGIWDTTCGRIYEENYVTLPGGFRLPFALILEEYMVYETEPGIAEDPQIQQRLTCFASDYICDRMNAGEILSRKLNFSETDSLFSMRGSYICREMIGTVRWEQIGDKNGKSD